MTSQALPKPVARLSLMPRGEEGRRRERVAADLTFVLWSSRTHCQAPWACLGTGPSGLSALFALLELCFIVLADTRLLLQGNRRKACLIKVAVRDSMAYS